MLGRWRWSLLVLSALLTLAGCKKEVIKDDKKESNVDPICKDLPFQQGTPFFDSCFPCGPAGPSRPVVDNTGGPCADTCDAYAKERGCTGECRQDKCRLKCPPRVVCPNLANVDCDPCGSGGNGTVWIPKDPCNQDTCSRNNACGWACSGTWCRQGPC